MPCVVVVDVVIDAPPEHVWQVIERIESHVEWMSEAVAIRFTGDRRAGVGTSFDTETRVGPIRLVDRMEVTAWEPGRSIGVRHVGVVTGSGHFALQETYGGGTIFTWREELAFPWWLGGNIGARLGGALVLVPLWRRNLGRLKRLVERGSVSNG